ncbi:MAG: fibronectin/fibrinogen-binding protein [Nitrospiraceae bacterium]|nr:MAG: fibronectin/fibrinogen-binding protein [Nitrospiraceae bacterium]
MPFDGVVAKCIVEELTQLLVGGRIEKIFQPEADEVVLNIRSTGRNFKLALSASANYPRIHITRISKENPVTPPNFCMLLRKHLSGGRIIEIIFHDYERIITLLIESVNELGDLSLKKLVIEIMGRHSNIILLNSEDRIMDSIKHIDSDISSVREVMPARPYILPPSQDKTSLEKLDIDTFIEGISKESRTSSVSIEKHLLNSIKGFSPLLCREICWRSGIDGKTPLSGFEKYMLIKLKETLGELNTSIISSDFSPCIIFEDRAGEKPLDFHSMKILQYSNVEHLSSISEALDVFYSTRDNAERLKQKKSDLFKVLNNNIDRCRKKLALQQEKLKEVADREKLKLYGELVTANIYSIPKNSKSVLLLDYYSENNDYIEVPLDENLLPQENAQKYYRQYSKAKSTYENTSKQVQETLNELEYLESVMHILENCSLAHEIEEIREELAGEGYLRSRKKRISRQHKPSEPLHYKSSEGLDILVGRNNCQNDHLTMKTASSNDIWLHTRNIPGSHVVVKKQQQNVPDTTLLEAAAIAAYHSKAQMSSNVPVDYTTVKNVKKPPGAKPGMVIYENFKTIITTPDKALIDKLKMTL